MISYRFTNDVDMADNKDFTPIYKLDFTDTPFTVKSKGIELKRYLVTNTSDPDFTSYSNLTLVDSLITNIIGFYSDDGAMLGFHYTDNFALHYSAYFYADHPQGDMYYDFKVFGYGKIRVKINNVYIIGTSSFGLLDKFAVADTTNEVSSGAIKLTVKTWYKIDVYYYSALGDSGFSLLWSNLYYGKNKYIPVSAGVCSYTGAFLTSTEVKDVISVSQEQNKAEVSALQFSVPLVVSGSTDRGYYYNTYWDKYCHSTENIALDKFKLVEFSAGYQIAGVDNYVKKFCGHIESFNPVRSDTNTINITCNSFENLYKQALNLNYPNIYDYWNANYAGLAISDANPDGVGCPITYDGWELHQAIKTLSIRAGIDPTLFLKKKLHLNSAGQVVSGTWLVEETSPRSVILDTNLNYGNAVVVNTEVGSLPDDEYILKSNFGDTLFDYINNIVDVYGWNWGNNSYYSGAPFLKATNNPKEIKTAKTDSRLYGNYWVATADLDTLSGKYYTTNNASDYLEFFFSGSKINLVTVGCNDSGVESTITKATALDQITVADETGFSANNVVVIETLLGEESVVIESISERNFTLKSELTSYPKKNGYIRTATFKAELKRGTVWDSGIDIQTTYHSCYFNNSYERLISPTNLSENTRSVLDTKRYYYNGIDPQTSVNPTVINIANGLTYDSYILRLTRLTNTQAGVTNNLRVDGLLVYDNDTNKITKTFYTGDSVVSGTIISLGVMDSGSDLRNDTIVVGRNLGVVTPGNAESRALNPNNPLYEYIVSRATDIGSIYDPNAINYTGMPRQTIQIAPEIASYDRARYWAVNFINRYRYPAKYPEFEIIGHPLLEEDDCIAVYDEGKKTLENFNRFWITGLNDTYEDKNYITQLTTTSYEPWESYTQRLTPDIADYGNKEIVNLKIKNGGNGTTTLPVGKSATPTVGGYYDPYSYDEKGIAITLQYDLVIDGYVRIDVYAEERNDILVATLLNPTGASGVEGWMRQEPGKNYIVTWDGVDMFGNWNSYCTGDSDESIGKMYFVHEGKAPSGTNGSGKFYFKFTILRRTTNGPSTLFSYDSRLLNSENTGYVYIKRGEKGCVSIISEPKCYFQMSPSKRNAPAINQYYDTDSCIPNVCFNDSIKYASDTPMNAKVNFIDITKNANWRSLFGVNVNMENTNFITSRGIQIKVTLTPCVAVVGVWEESNQVREDYNFKIHDPITIYDNQSFKNYQNASTDRYFHMKQFGYTYDNYAYYLGQKSTNTIKNAGGIIQMGFYLWVEIFAYDKSGRRLYTLVPSTLKDSSFILANGFWLFWLDDSIPWLATEPNLSGSNGSNASGYIWSVYKGSNIGTNLADASGRNLFEYIYNKFRSYPDLTDFIYEDNIGLVTIYPKVGYQGLPWGY